MTTSAQEPGVQTAASPGAASGAGTSSPQGTAPSPGPIPYDRFKEKVDESNSLKAEKARLESQLQQVAQQAQGYQQQAMEYARAMAQQSQAQQPPQPAPIDPYEENLQRQLGNDDAGREARKVLDAHAEYVARKNGYVTQDQVVAIAQQIAAQGQNKIQTAFQVTNEFQEMVSRGVVTPEQARGLQGQLNTLLAQNPQLANEPHNVSYLADSLFARAVKAGQIRPYSQPPPQNPMQPSGNGYTPAPTDPLAPINASALGFRTIKNLSPEKLRALTDTSVRAHNGATS